MQSCREHQIKTFLGRVPRQQISQFVGIRDSYQHEEVTLRLPFANRPTRLSLLELDRFRQLRF